MVIIINYSHWPLSEITDHQQPAAIFCLSFRDFQLAALTIENIPFARDNCSMQLCEYDVQCIILYELEALKATVFSPLIHQFFK